MEKRHLNSRRSRKASEKSGCVGWTANIYSMCVHALTIDFGSAYRKVVVKGPRDVLTKLESTCERGYEPVGFNHETKTVFVSGQPVPEHCELTRVA